MDSVALSVLCTVPQRRARGQNNETTNITLTVVLVVHYSAAVSGSEVSEVARARPRHGPQGHYVQLYTAVTYYGYIAESETRSKILDRSFRRLALRQCAGNCGIPS